jgi:hypothetical protein
MPHHHKDESDHHHHHHNHDISSTLSFGDKLIKRLEHWIKHNDEHAETYRNWAEKAKENGMEKTGELLEEVKEMTRLITGKFEEAIRSVKKR